MEKYFFGIRKISSKIKIIFEGSQARIIKSDFIESAKNGSQFEHSGVIIHDDYSEWEYTDSNMLSIGDSKPWMKAKPDYSIVV